MVYLLTIQGHGLLAQDAVCRTQLNYCQPSEFAFIVQWGTYAQSPVPE